MVDDFLMLSCEKEKGEKKRLSSLTNDFLEDIA